MLFRSDIERGNRLPAATTLVQLAQVLECSIDYILTGVSPDSEIIAYSDIGESAQKLLNFFYTLSEEDQEELIMIAEMKSRKRKRTISSLSDTENLTSETA